MRPVEHLSRPMTICERRTSSSLGDVVSGAARNVWNDIMGDIGGARRGGKLEPLKGSKREVSTRGTGRQSNELNVRSRRRIREPQASPALLEESSEARNK